MADVAQNHPSETTESTEATARRAVAHAVRHIRRWDEAGILAAIDKATHAGYDLAAIAAGLFDIAMDPAAKTPGVLVARLANGWRRHIEPPTPLPSLPRCDVCHLRHAAGTPHGDPRGAEDGDGYAAYLQRKAALIGGGKDDG